MTRDGARAFDLAEIDALRSLARRDLANARHHLDSMDYLADEDPDCVDPAFQARVDSLRTLIEEAP